jgi:anti-sigma B factor antagonist
MPDAGSRELEVHEEVTDQIRLVSLHGTLDMETAPTLEELLAGGASDPSRPLVVDLVECEFMDSVGLAVLLQGAKPLQNGEANVAFVVADGPVRKLLALTAVDRTIPTFETRSEAYASVLDPG